MPTPTPDPLRRTPSVDQPAGTGPSDSAGSDDGAAGGPTGSTGSHQTGGLQAPLSDLIRAGSSSGRRANHAADIAAQLTGPGPTDPPNTDDAPTVITHNRPALPTPPAQYVVGGTPSVAGRRLGHFELIEAVGSGGMAAVLKARDLELGRLVALKILPPEAARDPENVTRFKQEARAAALLDHENVARVYYYGEDQGLYFIAFEFVEGDNLRSLIDRRGPLPAGECVRYMLQLAAGLHHAAERGVVHRDVKPSNIIVTPDGRAKIVDMGLARQLEAAAGGVTQSGVTLGTFDYISPEQALDPRRADVRSDIYSLGCAFYHALTGRPPVPEGTAARKLHAHQHLDPLDPRELNPAVPDELAAVLARMMAKDPDQRYQTPAELIAHLKGVAGRLNLSLDAVVTDSAVRAVPAADRVLPEPPVLRLGWVAAAAAVAVAVAVFAAATSGPPTPSAPPWAADAGKKTEVPPAAAQQPAAAPHPAALLAGPDGFVTVDTADRLAQALEGRFTRVRLLPGLYDLTRFEKAVVGEGRQLELVGSGVTTTVRVAPGAARQPGVLTLAKAESVSVRGVRFELVRPPDEEPEFWSAVWDEAGTAGVVAVDVAELRLTDCVFAPEARLRSGGSAAVLAARTSADFAPRVRLERCLFAPGGAGLQVPPGSGVAIEDSGFGPHAAAVRVRPDPGIAPRADDPPAPTTIGLTRSSFMIDPGTVAVDADVVPGVRVTAGYCVFAPVGPPVPAGRGAVVRSTGERPGGVTFHGHPDHRNAYYRVDPVALVSGTGSRTYSIEECKVLGVPAEDPAAVLLRQLPWQNPDVLAALGSPADPFPAFRLRVTGPDADRSLIDPQADFKAIGAQFYNPTDKTRRAYPEVSIWLPLPPAPPAESKIKVWCPDPGPAALPEPGVYTSLVKLLEDAKSGDTVLIRHTGVWAMRPVRIEPARGEFRLTFKPEEGSRPVLAAAPTLTGDVSLFRLMDGELTFEGIQFLVKPPTPNQHRTVAAVTVVGGHGCTFRDCVFTLEEEDARAAAVMLVDPAAEMGTGPAAARPTPKVTFERCLVRGKGRAVWVPVSRPFDLDLTNSVTALDGPVVLAQPAGKDPGGAARSQVRLARVTALLGGPVIELHGGRVGEMRAAGLVRLDVEADGCLFAAVPAAGRPLVELTGIDPMDVDRPDNPLLTWRAATRPNRYANFDPSAQVVVIHPAEEADPARGWDWNQWLAFAREVGRPVGKVTFAVPVAGLKDLAALKPADAAVRAVEFQDLTDARPGDAGAEVRELPRPADANGETGERESDPTPASHDPASPPDD